MALIAAHLGIVSEDVIMDMAFDWFQEVLAVLGEVVNFSAIVNYAGNSFCEKSWDMILDNNPMLKGQILNAQDRTLEAFFNSAEVKVVKGSKKHGEENGVAGAGSNGEGQGPV